MSVIASFYTLPAERAPESLRFASPQDVSVTLRVLGLFNWDTSERRDAFDYLCAHARELACLNSGGRVIYDLDEYLADRGLPSLRLRGNATDFGLRRRRRDGFAVHPVRPLGPLRRHLRLRSRGSVGRATRTRPAPDRRRPGAMGTPADPVAGEIGLAEWAKDIHAARLHVVEWLKRVGSTEIGILDVG